MTGISKIIFCFVMAVSIAAPGSVSAVNSAEFSGAKATSAKYRVIFHVDSDAPGVFKKTLTNVQNLLSDPRLKNKVEIELLANSTGYKVFEKGNSFEPQLKELQARGVILAECENTLHELKVDKAKLYSFISYVPSGMGELTIRQGDGWAYLHPSPPFTDSKK
jgi:uncharacterized protein